MKQDIQKILEKAIKKLKTEEGLEFEANKIIIDYPKNEAFGDYTTNIAMILGKN